MNIYAKKKFFFNTGLKTFEGIFEGTGVYVFGKIPSVIFSQLKFSQPRKES